MPDEDWQETGRWRKIRTHRHDAGLDKQQREAIRRLESLGYMSGSVEAGDTANVTVHERERVYEGLNYYTSGHAPEAVLMDMDGEILHRWTYDFWQVWPDYELEDHLELFSQHRNLTTHWRRTQLLENGDILAIYEGLGMIKLDKDSRLIWAFSGRPHHDLEVQPNGEIYVLTREAHIVPRINPREPILEDYVSILDAAGRETRRISLLEAFERSAFRSLLQNSRVQAGDLFHTNSLAVLDGRIADRAPTFKKGRVLISSRVLNAIAVVDLELGEVVWALQGTFRRQHDPKVLPNGHLLLFDNHGRGPSSSVMELEVPSGELLWEFRGSEQQPFYSRSCGIAERLPNGNTLITESDNGRAIEITPEKEIVWEFYNPHRAGPKERYVATLFELVRLPPEFPLDWLPRATAGGSSPRDQQGDSEDDQGGSRPDP